jgi:1-acyl-sn-glycerol-3-phosphate acyltransferase
MASFRAAFKLLCFALLVILVVLTQPIVLFFTKGPASYVLPRLWHKAVCLVFGLRLRVVGTPCPAGQALYISNHLSYMDIVTLGALIKGSFVAKSEVEGWALFGFLSHLQQTAFIVRKKTEIGVAKDSLAGLITAGKTLIIFPEGTSTDGQSVRAFKSGLFMLATESSNPDLLVQPVTIHVDRSDGRPVRNQNDRDLYAWHIDMEMDLGPHLWRFTKTSGADLTITFQAPLRAGDYSDRKQLCALCYDAVSSGLLNNGVA